VRIDEVAIVGSAGLAVLRKQGKHRLPTDICKDDFLDKILPVIREGIPCVEIQQVSEINEELFPRADDTIQREAYGTRRSPISADVEWIPDLTRNTNACHKSSWIRADIKLQIATML
jgi:hypothetical protein